MAKGRTDPTRAELAVLEILWSTGPSTIRELSARLYRGGGVAHYATVQKLLDRLEAKRLVARDRDARAHVFRATLEPGAFLGNRLANLVDRLCGGSLAPLLTHLVRTRSLSAAERRELRALLDDGTAADPRRKTRRGTR